MAYKNQRKNKKHQAEIRKANSHKKHERKRRLNQKSLQVMSENYYLRKMREQGLI